MLDILTLVTVIGISDGDTLTVLHDRQPVKIRLAEIDAPEKRQPYGNRSKQSLSDLCFEKQAKVIPRTQDRYGRIVARVYCDDMDANAAHRYNVAWHGFTINTSQTYGLYAIQDYARSSGKELWADPDPVPPWDWRKGGR